MMELKEKALELAEHLDNANIISLNDYEMLADQDYSNVFKQLSVSSDDIISQDLIPPQLCCEQTKRSWGEYLAGC